VRYGGYIGIRRAHVEKAHGFFERNGSKTILFGRFIAVLRTWAAIIAGAACMSFTKFVVFNTAGSVAWSIVFGFLGYYFGRDLPLLERYISRFSLASLIIGAIAVVLFILYTRRKTRRKAARL
jgi:membrane-associated protein